MKWAVEFHDEFQLEFFGLPLEVRRTILALSRLLREFGPQLGRPRVDTLNGSRHANMKEMRFSAADGEWRRDIEDRAAQLIAVDMMPRGVGELIHSRLARLAMEGELRWA